MPKLIVMVGWSGAGKSTLARKIAEENDFALLKEDDFIFGMNPRTFAKKPAVARLADRQIGMTNLLSVVKNYMRKKKSLVVEGALVDGPLYLQHFAKIAKDNGYNFIPIMITADDKVRHRRKRKAKSSYVISRTQLDVRLIEAAALLEYNKISTVIDTTHMNMKKSVAVVNQAIN